MNRSPAELTDAFDSAIAALKMVISSSDASALQTLDLSTAHTFDVANCDWNTQTVSMQNYKYVGLPKTLPAGTYDFEVNNDATEPHLLIIAKTSQA